MHTESHPMAGKTVRLKDGISSFTGPYSGEEFRLEDWWDLLTGESWMGCEGNPACIIYSLRMSMSGLPLDDEVVYGKIGSFGHLIHVSEIENSQT